MACNSCGKRLSGICKVCEIVEPIDLTVKNVTFCNTCGVYICDGCRKDLPKRFKAFKIELKNRFKFD